MRVYITYSSGAVLVRLDQNGRTLAILEAHRVEVGPAGIVLLISGREVGAVYISPDQVEVHESARPYVKEMEVRTWR